MNIHSIHFEEGIKPRLRQASRPPVEQQAAEPKDSYLPTALEPNGSSSKATVITPDINLENFYV